MTRATLLIVGSVLWASVPILAYGTYLQSKSPQLADYQKAITAGLDKGDSQHDYGPGVGVGMVLASSWEFAAALYTAITLFVTVIVTVSHLLLHRHLLAGIASVAFVISVCVLAIVLNIRDASESFSWQFTLLGIGEATRATAFTAIVVLLPIDCWYAWKREHVSTRTPV